MNRTYSYNIVLDFNYNLNNVLLMSVTLISCVPRCFINHKKESKIMRYNVNLIKGIRHFFLSFFFCFCFCLFLFLFFFCFVFWYQAWITARNPTHYKEFITDFISLYPLIMIKLKFHQTRYLYFPFLFSSSVL